jgi:hypothetical protein
MQPHSPRMVRAMTAKKKKKITGECNTFTEEMAEELAEELVSQLPPIPIEDPRPNHSGETPTSDFYSRNNAASESDLRPILKADYEISEHSRDGARCRT